MAIPLTEYASLEHTSDYAHIAFKVPHRVLSCAVLNGGLTEADHIVNLKVAKESSTSDSPQQTLSDLCTVQRWHGNNIGMMTAASMDSLRMAKETVQGIDIVVLVTSGMSNPRRAGDLAEHRVMAAQSEEVGTINTIVITSALMTEAAMVEALMIVTEAKSAALQDAGVVSPVSNKAATGTGTDAVAIVGGHGPDTVRYCGKHVLFGEILGRLVTETAKASIAWDS